MIKETLLDKIHCYRDPNEALPEFVASLVMR